jgi:SAM-dependent methyltransferase
MLWNPREAAWTDFRLFVSWTSCVQAARRSFCALDAAFFRRASVAVNPLDPDDGPPADQVAAFRQRLTQLYRERIPAGAVVLDLMSSWVSHLPDDVAYASVIGHGLNARELGANTRLDRSWVQNLNRDQQLPLESSSVDATLIVAGWQYLQQPEAVAAELLRVTRPGGQLIVAFSNRMFFTKAPQIWADGSDRDHLAYVAEVLIAQGWPRPTVIAEQTRAPGLPGLIGAKGDPFFAVIASRPG